MLFGVASNETGALTASCDRGTVWQANRDFGSRFSAITKKTRHRSSRMNIGVWFLNFRLRVAYVLLAVDFKDRELVLSVDFVACANNSRQA